MKRRSLLATAALGCASAIGALAAYTAAVNLFTGAAAPLPPLQTKEKKKMRVLILGASGMVGGEVLRACLASENIEHITAIVRRPLDSAHAKLSQPIHSDFQNFSALDLSGFDACLYCIGAYTGTLGAAEYERVICGIPAALAPELRRQSPNIVLCHLSGAGADSTEQSTTAFARLFGKTENYLKSLHFARLHIFRPGYIYPVHARKEPHAAYTLMRWLYKPFLSHMKNSATTSTQLARAMLGVALAAGGKEIYENIDIEKYVG